MPDKTPPEMLADVMREAIDSTGKALTNKPTDMLGAWTRARTALTAYAEWQETHTAVLTERLLEVINRPAMNLECPLEEHFVCNQEEDGSNEDACGECWLAYLIGSDAGQEGEK